MMFDGKSAIGRRKQTSWDKEGVGIRTQLICVTSGCLLAFKGRMLSLVVMWDDSRKTYM